MDSVPPEQEVASTSLPETSGTEADKPQEDDTSPPASLTESEFTAVTLQSTSEEWQVVEIPPPPEEPKPLSSKAQKWKERLAKKGVHKSSGTTAATTATTTTATTTNTEGTKDEQVAAEVAVEESQPMTTTTTTEESKEETQAEAQADVAIVDGTDQGDSEIMATTDSSDIPVTADIAASDHETPENPDTANTDITTSISETPPLDPEPNQEEQQDTTNVAEVPSNAETPTVGDDTGATTNTDPVEESSEVNQQRNQPMSLQASYQEIAEAKRKKEEAARLEAEKRAEDERLAKEAERLESISRLEEERKRLRLEEQRKAQQELEQQQQQQNQQNELPQKITSDSVTPLPTSDTPKPTPTTPSTTSSKSMVVLVSKSFGTVEQRTNQDRAITSLKGQGIPFDEVDGSDPALKDIRNDLFAISGIRGSYPQFFIKDGNQITFLGDSDAFEYMNESGTLSQYFPLATEEPPVSAPVAVPVPVAPSTSTAKSLPTEAATASGKTVLVLVSKSFGTMTQRTYQERALTTLRAKGIPCEEVDGSDPALKDRRTQFFEISGLRGQYPQFFVKDGDTITFLGDFETFETLNETGQLVATTTVGQEPSTSRDMEETAPEDVLSSNKLMIVLVSKSFGTLAQKTNQERAITMLKGNKIPFDEVDGSNPAFHVLRNSLFAISGIRGNYPQFFVKEGDQINFLGDFEAFEALNDAGTIASSFATESLEPENEPPAALTSMSNNMIPSKKLIALVSKSFATVALTTNQERAFTMLRSKNIPFDEVDGSNPANTEQRNKLFDISGIRGKYPQFFIQDEHETTTYLGDLNVLEALNDMGTLSISLLLTTRPVADRPQKRSVSFTSAPNEVWENEYDSTPLPEPYSRSTSKDSDVVPQESFENEFNDDDSEDRISRSTSRTTSVDSFQVPNESFDNEFDDATEESAPTISRNKVTRANSEDSDMIPNESFENEFDSPTPSQPKKRLGRKSPDEMFENEFDPIDEEGTPKEADDDHPGLFLTTYVPMTIGVLGVAVLVGMWWSGQRVGPNGLHFQ